MICPDCNGSGQIGYAVDVSYYCPCPTCDGEREIDDPVSKCRSPLTWTTSLGKVLEIHDMEGSHILNCIHLCERREGHKGIKFLNNAPTYQALVGELINRGQLKYAYYDLSLEEKLQF